MYSKNYITGKCSSIQEKLSNYDVGYHNQVYTWPDALDMAVIKVQFNFV